MEQENLQEQETTIELQFSDQNKTISVFCFLHFNSCNQFELECDHMWQL
jgi:hypothetical protein